MIKMARTTNEGRTRTEFIFDRERSILGILTQYALGTGYFRLLTVNNRVLEVNDCRFPKHAAASNFLRFCCCYWRGEMVLFDDLQLHGGRRRKRGRKGKGQHCITASYF